MNYESANSTRSIGVFLPKTNMQWALFYAIKDSTRSPTQLYVSGARTTLDMTKPGVKIISYPSAKGLEFDTVFIPGINRVRLEPDSPTFNMHMYVLTSRARRELWFTYDGAGTPRMIKSLPLDLLDDRT